MSSKKITELTDETIPEIEEMRLARQEMTRLREVHRDAFSEYEAYADAYNHAAEVVERKLRDMSNTRQRPYSAPGFTFRHFTTRIDADKLFELMGEDKKVFEEVGGVVTVKPVFEVDRDSVLHNVNTGRIPKEIAESVVKTQAVISAPKKVQL